MNTTETTGYETAPATLLVATHCACCSRPLVDAPSVERGVGPTCAKKYGYADAQGPADWTAAALHALEGGAPLASTYDARRAANALTYRVAALQADAAVPHLIAAIAALGYVKLANSLAANLAPALVTVTAEGERLAVEAPYTPELTEAFRAIPGRRWDGERKVNTFPLGARMQLWGALKTNLRAGTMVLGSRGMTVLG